MTLAQFTKKHGNLRMIFNNWFKHTFTYVSVCGKYTVTGTSEYRSDLDMVLTVRKLEAELSDLDFYENKIEVNTSAKKLSAEAFIKSNFKGIEKVTWYPVMVALAEGYAAHIRETQDKITP